MNRIEHVRCDPDGNALLKGEYYNKTHRRYEYMYFDADHRRRCVTALTIEDLRSKKKEVEKNVTDRLREMEISNDTPDNKSANEDRDNSIYILSEIQQKIFLEQLNYEENRAFRALFTVLLYTGMRIGEAGALTWDDIDWDDQRIYVRNVLTPRMSINGRLIYELTKPKNSAGERGIPMLKPVIDVLLEEKRNREWADAGKTLNLNGKTGFVFMTRDGGFRTQDGANRKLKAIAKKYNDEEWTRAKKEHRNPIFLPEYLNCRSLRYSLCARLIEGGANIAFVQEIMGHRDKSTTVAVYSRIMDLYKRSMKKDDVKSGKRRVV